MILDIYTSIISYTLFHGENHSCFKRCKYTLKDHSVHNYVHCKYLPKTLYVYIHLHMKSDWCWVTVVLLLLLLLIPASFRFISKSLVDLIWRFLLALVDCWCSLVTIKKKIIKRIRRLEISDHHKWIHVRRIGGLASCDRGDKEKKKLTGCITQVLYQ